MNLYNGIYLGAALMALLAVLPALDMLNFKPFGDKRKRGPWRFLLWDLVASERGAVSIVYFIRGGGIVINGSATGPVPAQARQVMKQMAIVTFGVTADAQALFTHNWGLDGSAAPFGEPEVLFEPISTTTYWPLITFWRVNSNVVSINKPATDAPTTVQVTLRMPHSTGQ